MFKPHCTLCHKKLRKNDLTIVFGRSNIWHEICYLEHLEQNFQNAGLREITMLKKVKKSLSRVRSKILSLDSRKFDLSKFLKDFEINIISLKSITDTSKGLNIIEKNGIKKNLKEIFKNMTKLIVHHDEFLDQHKFSKTKLTLEQFQENNEDVLEALREKWIELADSLIDVHNKLRLSENKNQRKIRSEVQKQIDEIPERVERF